MMKAFAVGALLASLAVPASASSMAETAAATFKLYGASRPHCSMTYVGSDDKGPMFVTAAHCVVDEDELNYRTQVKDEKFKVLSEQVVYVKAVKTIVKKDIALLQVLDKDIKVAVKPVDVALVTEADTLVIGDAVMALGYPAAQVLAITKGEFTGKVENPFKGDLEDGLAMYQATVPVAGGNSGGGLYANFNGQWKLIGTTTGKRMDNDIMNWWQTTATVQEALRGFIKPATADIELKTEPTPAGDGKWEPEEK